MDLNKAFIDNNLNPFVVFDAEGHVLQYNDEGEYILSVIDKDELYNLAVSHASMSFGFKHSFLDIDIGHSSFCAISVGYINSDTIGIMLHKNVCSKKYKAINEDLQPANIFTLLDIAINTNLDQSTHIEAEYDVSIPEFKLNINNFLQLLNKIFKALKNSPSIYIRVAIATGCSIKIDNKRYPVINIDIKSPDIPSIESVKDDEFIISIEKETIHIELPFIT